VNLVQDNVGAYGGDASYEMRTITSTEASTGLVTLTQIKFTPGAHQLHVNYNGHDFIAPDFLELGGGQVQFPLAFFNTGDTAKFYVGYGLINKTDAPMTINNMLSSNDTLGSVAVPSGFTLDKPYMNIPAGAVVSGAGAISTDGYITGAGVLATTGPVLSRGKAPTQPKFDRIEEATPGQSVAFPNGLIVSPTSLSNSQATALGLKQYFHGTTYNGGNSPTVSLYGGGGTLTSIATSYFIPYQLQDGSWMLRFMFFANVSLASRTAAIFEIAGIVLRSVSPVTYQISGGNGNDVSRISSYVYHTGRVYSEHATGNTNVYTFTGEIPLQSKPAWAY